MSTDVPRYGQVDRDYGMRLATTPPDEDGPVWMVNLMSYREVADYLDGRESTITGQAADDLYAPYESLAAVGAEIVFFGDVDQQLLGDDPVWDRIAVVKYPTRRSFIDMQARPEFQEAHHHKEAGMDQTFVIGCQPIDDHGRFGGAELPDWADVPHPPTDDDGPVVVLHVIRFDEFEEAALTPTEMQAYQSAAAEVAVAHGIRVTGWFAVEGTIVGDGRQWHQVRFNAFPSKAAFMAVATDPARVDAHRQHRGEAIADTYTIIVRPQIDRILESIGA